MTYRGLEVHRQRLDGNLLELVVLPGLIANHVQIYRVKIFGGLLPAQVHLVLGMTGQVHDLRWTWCHNVCPLHDSVGVVAVVLPRVRLYVDLVLRVRTWRYCRRNNLIITVIITVYVLTVFGITYANWSDCRKSWCPLRHRSWDTAWRVSRSGTRSRSSNPEWPRSSVLVQSRTIVSRCHSLRQRSGSTAYSVL